MCARFGPSEVVRGHSQTVKLIRKEVSHQHTRLFLFFVSLFVSISSSSPLCYPDRKPLLTSRWLCFCLDLRIEFFGGPTIKYGIEIAPLFLLRQCEEGVEGNYLPPSLHYAACFPVSASQVLPPPPHPIPPPPSRSPSMQRQVNMSPPPPKKGERTDQTGKHKCIPTFLMMCTYRQLLAVLLPFVCVCVL